MTVFQGYLLKNTEQLPLIHVCRILLKNSCQRCEDLLLGSMLSSIDLSDSFVIVGCCFITLALYCNLKAGSLIISALLYLFKMVLNSRY